MTILYVANKVKREINVLFWVTMGIFFLGFWFGRVSYAQEVSKMKTIDQYIKEIKDGLHPNSKLCEICGLPCSANGDGCCSGDSAWKKRYPNG
jgi:hypothetical protein